MGDDFEDKVKKAAKSSFEWLNEEAEDNLPFVKKIHRVTQIPSSIIALIGTVYLVHQAWVGAYAELISILVGTIYPAFKSIQALQTDTSVEDDKAWLTYWIVYGSIVIADQYVHFILEFIPMYYFVKLCVFLWLQIPGPLNGAQLVFRVVVRPLYTCLRPVIKRWASENRGKLCDFDKEVQSSLEEIQGSVMGSASEYFVQKAMEGL